MKAKAKTKTYTFDKECAELEILEKRLNIVKENLKNPDDYDLDLVYKEIVKIAYAADYLSEHKYCSAVDRLEKARKLNKSAIITSCVVYANSLLNLTKDYITLKLFDNLLCAA